MGMYKGRYRMSSYRKVMPFGTLKTKREADFWDNYLEQSAEYDNLNTLKGNRVLDSNSPITGKNRQSVIGPFETRKGDTQEYERKKFNSSEDKSPSKQDIGINVINQSLSFTTNPITVQPNSSFQDKTTNDHNDKVLIYKIVLIVRKV